MNSGKYTIDQIENGIATLLWKEDERERNEFPVAMFPFKVQEGDIVEVSLEGNEVKINQRKEETTEAKRRAEALLNKLIDKNK